ncbi:MAG TPA: DNA repair protein RecN [Burkholderiales bacterium]|nr:DNA repair protein RecN [Burkholderiales bacterium]
MLRALEIRNFVIVERASLEPDPGFNVLTGETGAGKSILVDAIELLVGGRADASVVREGAEKAELSAEFEVESDTLASWLKESDLEGDAGQLIVRRTIDRSGRSRAFINGHAATAAQLKDAGERLVDIHGQHAHQSLLRPAGQRELLDAHAGNESLAKETSESFRAWKRLEAVAFEAQKDFAQRRRERDDLSEAVRDLKKLAVREGEWERASAEQKRLSHGSSLLAGAQSALEALDESEGAALAQLAAVSSRLKALSEHDESLEPVMQLLESAQAQAGEAVRELRQYASRLDLDPEALREAEGRVEALHAAARKHRVKPEGLHALLENFERRLGELELATDPQALEREVAAARGRYEAAAAKLSAGRKSGAESLSKAVTASMQQLAMAGGRFAVSLKKLTEAASTGFEEIEFEMASHPSLPLRALAKVASGGELARVSLAIQLAAARSAPVATLVFDEVDAGIGGSVADTIGRSLRKLGKKHQVLCVTHLPQVAACADAQWSVSKPSSRSEVQVKVARLDHASRIEELARMLGGSEGTARRHAAELLADD